MCALLGVSESGYWAWVTRPPSDRELSDAWLTERIRQIHAASGGRYGRRRVRAMLAREDIGVGEKRVARLMRAAGLQGAFKRRGKGCTVRVAGVQPFGDLVGRDFRPDAPDRVWVADIKQIRTGEGWLYLAAVQDLFSRRIVGWAMEAHMRQFVRGVEPRGCLGLPFGYRNEQPIEVFGCARIRGLRVVRGSPGGCGWPAWPARAGHMGGGERPRLMHGCVGAGHPPAC
ncbi:MAG: putative transposase [Solirubrobacteraceae bacterium]|jgi:hypothetical protein|nr:putative transposase [Solirubrobacteraceae bacterium]